MEWKFAVIFVPGKANQISYIRERANGGRGAWIQIKSCKRNEYKAGARNEAPKYLWCAVGSENQREDNDLRLILSWTGNEFMRCIRP